LPDFMGANVGAALPAATAGEVFVVLKRNAALGTGLFLWRMGPDDSNWYFQYPMNYGWTDGGIYDEWGSTVRRASGKPARDLTTLQLYNVVSPAGEWTPRLNGALHFSTKTNSFTLPAGAQLGRSDNYYGGYFNRDVAEVIVSDRALSQAERDAVGTF